MPENLKLSMDLEKKMVNGVSKKKIARAVLGIVGHAPEVIMKRVQNVWGHFNFQV